MMMMLMGGERGERGERERREREERERGERGGHFPLLREEGVDPQMSRSWQERERGKLHRSEGGFFMATATTLSIQIYRVS